MSKMSELALCLDELTEVGGILVTCGQNLMKAAGRIKDCFSNSPEEPAAEERPAPKEDAPKTYTKEEVRAILTSLSQSGFRAEAKELVRIYSGGGSLTDIDPAKYPELIAEAEGYHA